MAPWEWFSYWKHDTPKGRREAKNKMSIAWQGAYTESLNPVREPELSRRGRDFRNTLHLPPAPHLPWGRCGDAVKPGKENVGKGSVWFASFARI